MSGFTKKSIYQIVIYACLWGLSQCVMADIKYGVWSQATIDAASNGQGSGLEYPLYPLIIDANDYSFNDFFPLDTGYEPGYWEQPWSIENDPFGIWAFANRDGRVRSLVRSGVRSNYSSSGEVWLSWQGFFIRDTDTNPTFTINDAHVEIIAQKNYLGYLKMPSNVRTYIDGVKLSKLQGEDLPKSPATTVNNAQLMLFVYVERLNPDAVAVGEPGFFIGNPPNDIFLARARMQGTMFENRLRMLDNYTFVSGFKSDENPHPLEATAKLEAIHDWLRFNAGSQYWAWAPANIIGKRFTYGPYTGEIDLDAAGIRNGDHYRVGYLLWSEAGEDQEEVFAESYIADPLDNGGEGLSLSTDHTPTTGPRISCNIIPDPSRYTINNDGTATDVYTGLMWQRCPNGTTLNDNGTPEADDDVCDPNTFQQSNWQSALQTAQASTDAGHSDWRLPNIKELESIVAEGCSNVATDRLAFPDTPDQAFWSSTPVREDPIAWAVNFTRGDVQFLGTSTNAHVRLVRDSGLTPQAIRPRITVSRTDVNEANAGSSSTMQFRLRLSSALTEDVTIDYEVEALTATETVDYIPTTGVLTIPAGDKVGTIDVVINGDDDAENNETIRLLLTGASSNVHLSHNVAIGTIIDNEPVMTALIPEFETLEGDAGDKQLEVKLAFNQAITSSVNLDYVTEDVNANAGADYTQTSGTLTVNSGATEASIFIPITGDQERENDEEFILRFSNGQGVRLATNSVVLRIVDNDYTGTFVELNDTGISHCATLTNGGLACPQANHPAQDGEVGRDATVNDPNDGELGFSFTKLDAGGNDLPRTENAWDCVRDEVTGLVWEAKVDNNTALRHDEWFYSWYNSSGVNDGGSVGTANTGTCVDAANCDTEKYVAAVNASNLCGFNDWRLPTVDEAFSIAHMSLRSFLNLRGLETIYFPLTGNLATGPTYWTSTPFAQDPDLAWAVEYGKPETRVILVEKSSPINVRLVRGGAWNN